MQVIIKPVAWQSQVMTFVESHCSYLQMQKLKRCKRGARPQQISLDRAVVVAERNRVLTASVGATIVLTIFWITYPLIYSAESERKRDQDEFIPRL